MPLFHDLIQLANDANSLSTFLAGNIQSFYNLHNSSIESLNEEKNDIRDFIESKRLIFEQLDFSSNTNKAFVSILFDFAERFGFLSIVNIENILKRNELYLGRRREAAKLFLLNIRNNNDYISRYDSICELLQTSLETEEDTDKDVLSTFLNYYAKVVNDTSLDYSTQLNKLVLESESRFLFLQNEFIQEALAIDLTTKNAYSLIQEIIDTIYDRTFITEEELVEPELIFESTGDYYERLKTSEISFKSIYRISCEKSNWDNFLSHRGVKPLETEAELYTYIKAFGTMHREKMLSALKKMNFNEITSPVDIIDWGCGQGLASLVFLDYVNENNINLKINSATLIEPSIIALKRAALHLHDKIINIKTVHKGFNKLQNNDIKNSDDSIKIHLFSNVLDIDDSFFNQTNLISKIKETQSGVNYFICCSPYITDFKTTKIDNFVNSFDNKYEIYSISERKGKWAGTNWSRVIRVFKCLIE